MIKPIPILLIDNFDSFTFNLFHLLQKFDCFDIDVIRNNELEGIDIEKYHAVVISPGPGIPAEAGGLMQFISENRNSTPMLGICLGHQALIESFGGQLKNLSEPFHGIKSMIKTNQSGLFSQLPEQFYVARYHSWVADLTSLPTELICTAVDNEGNCMAFSHRSLPVWGVQFHPESILCEYGEQIVTNWINQLMQIQTKHSMK